MTYAVSFGVAALFLVMLSRFTARRGISLRQAPLPCCDGNPHEHVFKHCGGSAHVELCKPSIRENVAGNFWQKSDGDRAFKVNDRSERIIGYTANCGIEYFYHSKVGVLTIAPLPELPSAAELRIEGRACGLYVSAAIAADAVAMGQTEHKQLNALSAADRPQKLADWEKSSPHQFKT